EWTSFASAYLLQSGYSGGEDESSGPEPIEVALLRELGKSSRSQLEAGLATADSSRKPYLLWLIAEKATEEQDWARAESACSELESAFPSHVLCRRSDYPVQARPSEKPPKEDKPNAAKHQEEKLRPEVAGTMIELLR